MSGSGTSALERILHHLDAMARGEDSVADAEIAAEGEPAVRLALEQLRALQRRSSADAVLLAQIVENLPHMIFVKDAAELRFVLFNRAGEELLGHAREQMLGKNDYDFFPKEEADFFTEKDRQVLDGGVLVDIPEEPIHTRDKGRRWLHTKKIPIFGEDGAPKYLLGISEDITERKGMEESNVALDQFATAASHDLQEPLRMVTQYLQLLDRRYADRLDDAGREFLAFALDGAVRMRELIRSLLALARIDMHGRPSAPVDCAAALQEACANLLTRIEDAGAVVTHDALPVVQADHAQVVTLFQNLLANALKFHGDAPPRVHVSARRDGPLWEVGVADNGIGVEPEHAERIFEAFTRLHARGSYAGTGMGLAICQRIVERHGGTIRVEPAEGGGSIFRFTLRASER